MVTNRSALLDGISDTLVGVIGDVMLDQYTHGRIERISPEAPVPVVVSEKVRYVPGGAGNSAAGIAALGGRAELVSVIGSDVSGKILTDTLRESSVTPELHTDANRLTTVKHRVIHQGRHLLRIDEETRTGLSAALEEQVIASVAARIASWKALVIADYAKGFMTERLAHEVMCLARARGIPVVIDTKPAHISFFGAAAVYTPNLGEALRMAETEDVFAAGELLSKRLSSPVLITRGKDGMTLFDTAGTHHLHSYAQDVVDVSGAGDTVAATLALLLAVGTTLPEAMHIANSAAALAISKEGTARVTRAELASFLETYQFGG